MQASEGYWEKHRKDDLQAKVRILESLVEVLNTEIELRSPHSQTTEKVFDHSVFLIHGHDETIIHEIARFLESLELKIIILREQANEGRTIIEKFEDFSDNGFAVILLTRDDKGGPKDASIETLKPRARQNVILELGYFLGKLSRSRVCPLYREGVEIPSDYLGLIFVALDSGGSWKLELAREMKASGMDVDLNKAIG